MLDHQFVIEKVVEEGGWAAIVARKGEV